jgi:DcrB
VTLADRLPTPLLQRRGVRLVLGLLALAGALLLLIYGLVVAFGNGDGGQGGSLSGPAQAGGPSTLARFDVPAGWEDGSRERADDVGGVRADAVFLGPSSGGFRSNLNVVRQPRGDQTPALDDLVTIVSGKVTTDLSAEVVGGRRRLTLDGVPAVAYDYRYQADGRRLQGRQVVTLRAGMVVFVNFTARQDVFEDHVKALDVLTGSWRWG